MIKIFIAFVLFAALSLFVIFKGGDIDMGGEKHSMDAPHTEQAAPAAPATPVAPAASQPQ